LYCFTNMITVPTPSPRRLIAVLKTKICDTPRARKNDAQLHIVTMIHCPGTATCRMHPM
jgi:hypothetical protein